LEPETANRWRRTVSQFATNALGKSMWVRGSDAIDGAHNARANAIMDATIETYLAATDSALLNF
jgi:hypothetical protein